LQLFFRNLNISDDIWFQNDLSDIIAIITSFPKVADMLATRAVTVRNLPADIHAALRLRAAQHQRSTEAEIRAILAAAVASPPSRSTRTLGRFSGLLAGQTDKIATIDEINDAAAAGWAGEV